MQADPGPSAAPVQPGLDVGGVALLTLALGWYCSVSQHPQRQVTAPPARFTPPSDLHDLKEAYLLRMTP